MRHLEHARAPYALLSRALEGHSLCNCYLVGVGALPCGPLVCTDCLQESRALGQGLCNHAQRSQRCVPETCTRCTEGACQRHVPSVPGCVPGTCTKGVYQILPFHVPDLPLHCHGKSGTTVKFGTCPWYMSLARTPVHLVHVIGTL